MIDIDTYTADEYSVIDYYNWYNHFDTVHNYYNDEGLVLKLISIFIKIKHK